MSVLLRFKRLAQHHYWLGSLLLWLSICAFFVALRYWAEVGLLAFHYDWLLVVLLSSLVLVCMGLLGYFRKIKFSTLARHLNHYFPALEYSTQLLLEDETGNQLHRLQRQKVLHALNHISDKAFVQTLSPLKLKPIVLLFSLSCSVLLSGFLWSLEAQQVDSQNSASNPFVALELESVEVSLTAPAYMELPVATSQVLNIETWQGAQVEWRLTFNRQDTLLTLQLSGGEQLAPKWQERVAIFRTTVTQSQSYHLRLADQVYKQGFYSILVNADRKPEVRFVDNSSSTLSFAKQHTPVLDLTVNMRDDFGLSDSRVRMSLARGSGEAVKFRDIERTLAGFEANKRQQTVSIVWDLTELGMEPGDELYLAVVAWDNKPNEPQEGKSSTIIVKWLDEQSEQVTAAGIVTDLELEYFKSQRQIIIETKQLIQDRQQLAKAEFNETSRQLGLAQSDLKQRYGQYLGDEFEGVAMHVHSVSEDAHHEEEEHDGEHEESHPPEAIIPGSAHDHGEQTDEASDLSGRMALINQFGHAHGDADIGPVMKFNPKAYMKRSVEQMWSAELHLMLGEPEKALPFEEEALKYLKLARQADRIYVKRLGFEPPPVSEEKRLTGELDEILSPDRAITFALDDSSQQLLQDAYQLLSLSWGEMDPTSITLLDKLRQWIATQVEDRPALIQTQVQLETLLANRNWQPAICRDCQQKIQQKVWQLLSAPKPAAFTFGVPFLIDEVPLSDEFSARREISESANTPERP